MKALETLYSAGQYSIQRGKKEALLLEELTSLHRFHYASCGQYRLIQEALPLSHVSALCDVPFLPVRLFKELKLQSVPEEAVVKLLTSSGTMSQQVARIAVDRETSLLQTKALASIVTSFLGPKRLPMIIVDSRSLLRDRTRMSARGAGVVGMSNFGRDHFYALDEQMQLDFAGLRDFINRHGGEPVLVFGFTFMIWEYLVGALRRMGESITLEHGILIHGGGWKKLQDHAVSNEDFKQTLRECCGITRVHNYYGMAEQVGNIYMECEHGFLHAPNFAEIIIRDPGNWQTLPPGHTGVIETLSVLPRSYPGHALLTEDQGTLHGVDDCPCGRLGTRFTVAGRLPRAELRGCSDTHAYEVRPAAAESKMTVLLPVRRELAGLDDLPGDTFFDQEPLRPFFNETVAFLDSLSQTIFSFHEYRDEPHLAALAFWLRRSNISRYVRDFRATLGPCDLVAPRGTAFHVPPSNVEPMFFYSWALSLLAGNSNIVRLPANLSAPMHTLLEHIRTMLEEPKWSSLAARNLLLFYPRNDELNRYFSLHADIRIIWGGDETALHFRALPAKPVVKDVIFGDKVSFSLVHAARYLDLSDGEILKIAHLFHNDAYQFDQMACSSPRLVCFAGFREQCEQASRRFWEALGLVLVDKGADASRTAMDKLVFGCLAASRDSGGSFPYGLPGGEPSVIRIEPCAIASLQLSCGGGVFFEYFASAPEELVDLVQARTQTLTYVGYSKEEIRELAEILCARGIDRIVPFGRALEFSPIWDGYVLFSELTRRVSIV